jgi:hypothetical protein
MVLGDEGYHVVHYLEGVAFVVLYGYIGQYVCLCQVVR